MKSYIEVISPGFFTTVQDRGRCGYQSKGIPVSGAMDLRSYSLANGLVDNSGGEAVLEMTAFGGSYRFGCDAVFALTGADMTPSLNGDAIAMNKSHIARSGDILRLGAAVNGFRTYLAVKGGIDVPPVLGSRSTYVKCAIGGFGGRELKKGDILPVTGSSDFYSKECDYVPYADKITVRVVLGPQDYMFTPLGIKTFLSSEYTVSELSDRMGCRLNGETVEAVNGTDIISDATVFGSVQITGSGQPIILMADRQTSGGYAKIASVISDDLPLIAQAKPGTVIHFTEYNQEYYD